MTDYTDILKTKSMVHFARRDRDNPSEYVVSQANGTGDVARFRLTIEDGVVTKLTTYCYRLDDKEYTKDELAKGDEMFEPFVLDSYTGAIFFDAAFG